MSAVPGNANAKLVIAVAAAAVVLVAAIGFLVLVRPQRAESQALDRRIGETQATIDEYRALERQGVEPLRIADLFRLTKAMPDDVDMPGVLLELSRIANDTGIVLESISPQESAAGTGYDRIPIELVFRGNFYDLSDFLYRLRNLVTVHGGELAASGRLFSISSLQFVEGPEKFPQLQSTVVIDAFAYGDSGADGSAAAPGTTPPATTPPATPPSAPPTAAASAAGVGS